MRRYPLRIWGENGSTCTSVFRPACVHMVAKRRSRWFFWSRNRSVLLCCCCWTVLLKMCAHVGSVFICVVYKQHMETAVLMRSMHNWNTAIHICGLNWARRTIQPTTVLGTVAYLVRMYAVVVTLEFLDWVRETLGEWSKHNKRHADGWNVSSRTKTQFGKKLLFGL